MRKPKTARNNEESRLQEWYAMWLWSKKILFNASMAGVYLGFKAAIARKKMGCRKGFPDIFIYEPRGAYHGMAIELKIKGGIVSKEQLSWQMDLDLRKYVAVIMPNNLDFRQGQDWLVKITEEYLRLKG